MVIVLQGMWEAKRLASLVELYAQKGVTHKEWAVDLGKRLRKQIRDKEDAGIGLRK